MNQTIYRGFDSYKKIAVILNVLDAKKILIVCGESFKHLSIKEFIELINVEIISFSNFGPNPLYEDVCKGVDMFNKEGCDVILAIGGGSAIDVGKCIKLFSKMDKEENYLKQAYFDSSIPLIAIPTTAGTGSESTQFAVIYLDGEKQSINHQSIIPEYVILDPTVLKNLPVYQKKCTMLDALCQAIESWWSVNSTYESKEYSKTAIKIIADNWKPYIIENNNKAADAILFAANYAGRAINVTQTTAAHAMSYKLTSMYKLPHGHAVALCLPEVWEYMNGHIVDCIDIRGSNYLFNMLLAIAKTLKCKNTIEAIKWFRGLLNELEICYPNSYNRERDIEVLTASVNPIRLNNNPIVLNSETLRNLYERIVKL